MRLFALLLSISLVGCSLDPVDWHGDETFTPAERAEIERANVWLADRLRVAPFSIAWDAPHRSYPRPGEIGRVDPITESEAGYFYEGRILIGADRIESVCDCVAGVAAHEMAHARGLSHHNGRGLMASHEAILTSPLTWTIDDASLVGGSE